MNSMNPNEQLTGGSFRLALAGLKPWQINRFRKWHKRNPQLWKIFDRTAFEAMIDGRNVPTNEVIDTMLKTHKLRPSLDFWFAEYYARLFNFKYEVAYFEIQETEAA